MPLRKPVKRAIGHVILCILICLLIPTGDCGAAERKLITIRGHIFSGSSKFPVTELRVTLETFDLVPVSIGVTDASGIFYLPNVPPGRYLLRIDFLRRLITKQDIEVVPYPDNRYTADPNDPNNVYWDLPPIELNSSIYRDIPQQ
jgi:hypothetical protein